MKKKKEEKIYKWRTGWIGSGVNPDDAIKEISKAEKRYGEITPKTVLIIAKNKKSAIHSLFDWDDAHAAEQHRLYQARKIINNLEITVIRNSEPIGIPVFEVINKENHFKSVEVMTVDDVEFIKLSTIKQLEHLTIKLSIYRKFDEVIKLLNEAKEKLEKS